MKHAHNAIIISSIMMCSAVGFAASADAAPVSNDTVRARAQRTLDVAPAAPPLAALLK